MKGKRRILGGYVGNITVKPRPEQFQIVVAGKASFWESFPQSSSSWEEALRVELLT